MEKLKKRWGITSNWQILIILIVFSITGTTSLFVTEPLLDAAGLVKENFTHTVWATILYYIVRLTLILIVYQFLLLGFGWLFGQYSFFWNIVRKMLVRIGFKSLKRENE
ncbi:MAG TPA: DUF6787 family protein [Flavobacteriaceae bacterium]|nr:DUF6787 family protein [Flavobacteriaceae bacterium]